MTANTKIEWADATWNPVSGCTKISEGCDNCYAETIAERFRGSAGFPNGFDLTLKPNRLDEPKRWREPKHVFVNSMSDLYHKEIPSDYLQKVFDTMLEADHHKYLILTKRSSLMRDDLQRRWPLEHRAALSIPDHIWPGVTIESPESLVRLEHLKHINSRRRFVSFEPLLADIGDIDLTGIAWAIVGGESGSNARPIDADWVRRLRYTCQRDGVKFFFKQWGGRTSKAGGRLLDGREWNERPE